MIFQKSCSTRCVEYHCLVAMDIILTSSISILPYEYLIINLLPAMSLWLLSSRSSFVCFQFLQGVFCPQSTVACLKDLALFLLKQEKLKNKKRDVLALWILCQLTSCGLGVCMDLPDSLHYLIILFNLFYSISSTFILCIIYIIIYVGHW